MRDASNTSPICEPPEVLLARLFKEDLGVAIDPQALRLFIRWRWNRISPIAHRIHDV